MEHQIHHFCILPVINADTETDDTQREKRLTFFFQSTNVFEQWLKKNLKRKNLWAARSNI